MAIGIAVALRAVVGRQDVVGIVVVLAQRGIPSAGNCAVGIRRRLTGAGVDVHTPGMHEHGRSIDNVRPKTGAHATSAGIHSVPALGVANGAGGFAYFVGVRRIRAAAAVDDQAAAGKPAAIGIGVAPCVVQVGLGSQNRLTEIASWVGHDNAAVHRALVVNGEGIAGVITGTEQSARAIVAPIDRGHTAVGQRVTIDTAVVRTTAAMVRIGLRIGAFAVAALKVAAAGDGRVEIVRGTAVLAASFLSRCGGVADAVTGHTGATDETAGAISANSENTVSIRMRRIPTID